MFLVTYNVFLDMGSGHVYGERQHYIDKKLLLLPLRPRDSQYILRDKELNIRRLR